MPEMPRMRDLLIEECLKASEFSFKKMLEGISILLASPTIHRLPEGGTFHSENA